MRKLIALSVEGVKVIDLCIEGDKLLEEATGGVYNKPVKGIKVSKGTDPFSFSPSHAFSPSGWCRDCLPDVYFCQQRRLPFFPSSVRFRVPGPPRALRLKRLYRCSSDSLASQALVKDDVVKLHIGAHIDGFAAISAETIVVGASEQNPVTGRRADVLKAAWHAAEAAMRLVKVGNKNWAVTDGVAKVVAAWDCKPVEGTCDRSRDHRD